MAQWNVIRCRHLFVHFFGGNLLPRKAIHIFSISWLFIKVYPRLMVESLVWDDRGIVLKFMFSGLFCA